MTTATGKAMSLRYSVRRSLKEWNCLYNLLPPISSVRFCIQHLSNHLENETVHSLPWVPLFLLRPVVSAALPRHTKAQPIVNLGHPYNVSFTGHLANDVESFLNLRFGQDTSAENRFAAPTPFTYRKGSIVDASHSGEACPQQIVPVQRFSVFDNVTDISEDYFTPRVDRPSKTSSSAKLPVMVYIYGGGETIGQIYDSRSLHTEAK